MQDDGGKSQQDANAGDTSYPESPDRANMMAGGGDGKMGGMDDHQVYEEDLGGEGMDDPEGADDDDRGMDPMDGEGMEDVPEDGEEDMDEAGMADDENPGLGNDMSGG